MSTICEGLTVLELGAGSVPGATIGMVLADNGARVVKIEPPEGDRLRRLLPTGALVWNRGKESIVLDARTTEGQREVRRLAERADIVVEGFGAGVAEAWGIGPEDLCGRSPSLIYCSVKGFGRSGPYAHLKAYDALVMAKCGLFARGAWGFRDGPIFSGVSLASHGAAHTGIGGIMAALMVRERTGLGQVVDVSLVRGLAPADLFGLMHWQYAARTGAEPHVILAPVGPAMAATRYGLLSYTKDGRVLVLAPMLPHQSQALTRVVGLGHLIEDPRYASMGAFPTAEDAQAWEDMILEAIRSRTLAEWIPILESDLDVPFEVARTHEEGLDHPQVLHNGNAIVVEHPDVGPIRQVGPIARFGRTPSVIQRSAPAVGVHGGELTGPRPTHKSDRVPAHPLDGITIVELGYFYAMPFAVSLAGSLGARVIKIEGAAGDPMRTSFGVKETGSVRTMEAKESLSIDVSTPAGRKIMHELIADADAFVTGFRPGVPERLGLDYATLADINPRLVYVHAAGYGADGPYSPRPMYAHTAGAIAGNTHRQSAYWTDPERLEDWSLMEIQAVIGPRLRPLTDGDCNAASAVFSALMLGLAHQRRTGEGQFIGTSMINGNAYAYSDDFNAYAGKPSFPVADPEQLGFNALYRLYETLSGWVFLAAPTQREWEALAISIDRADLLTDTRFATAELRIANSDALADALGPMFATSTADDWEALLAPKGVGCVRAFEHGHSAFACTDPVLRDTGHIVEVDHPVFGRILRYSPLVQLSRTPGRNAPSCLRGDHNEAILADLGYDAAQIDSLMRDKVIFAPD